MFTPFWRACREQPRARPARPLARLPPPRRWPPRCRSPRSACAPGSTGTRASAAAWSPGEASARASLKRFVGHGLAQYADARESSRPRRQLAPVAPSSLRGARPAGRLERRRAGASAAAAAQPDRSVAVPARARLARVRLSPPSSLPPLDRGAAASRVPPLPLGAGDRRAGLAARSNRLPAGRRRHARALGHRLSAQPRPDGGGVVPGQAPARSLAGRGAPLLGHAGGRRSGEQHPGLAVVRRLAASTPLLTSASSIRSFRARRPIPTACT